MNAELKKFSLRGGLVLALTVLLANGALAQGRSAPATKMTRRHPPTTSTPKPAKSCLKPSNC